MRRNFTSRPIRLGVLVVCLFGSSARGESAPRGSDFFEEVAARFDRWDADHDGRLSKTELLRLVDNPAIKGREAAALAALVRVARGDKGFKAPADVDREYVVGLASGWAKHPPNKPPLADWYLDGLLRLAGTNRTLFGTGQLSLHAFHQGTLGDCFVVAPLGAAVARDPAAVRRMIQARPDGSYRVTFGNGTAIDVPALTDTELILSSTSAGHGLWINVFEKAYAIYRNRQVPNGNQSPSVLETISHGGPPARTIEAITGHHVKAILIRKEKDPAPTGAAQAAVAQQIATALFNGFAGRRLACAITASHVDTPGLPAHHVYAIHGYDPTKREVRLWNPHGNTFNPKGPAGLSNGYPTKDGFFTMPLDELLRVFVWVNVEEAK
jgi:hypothetical protein